jgi:predicted ATP-grasp superfamily ATP-dependent carboligase
VRVLVTDAEYKLTLGAIRSLGRRGVHVVAGAAVPRAQGFRSRYTGDRFVYPSPERDPDGFIDSLLDAARGLRADALLPIGYASTRAVSRRKDDVAAQVAVAVADWDGVQIAGSKKATLELAAELGVPTPRLFASPAAVDRFPVVVKSNLGSGGVRYVNNEAELDSAIRKDSVIQEYVPGEGRGYFALFAEGEERAAFMHRRVREYPVTGGASTAAESVFDPELRALGHRLLEALEWHGVAMAEFKLDARDGRYKLMELNPKFWGSLDLAIAAGVDFPWLAVQVALGHSFPPVVEYRRGLRFQWVFSDLLHAAARPSDLPAVLRDLAVPRVAKDVWLRDLRPNLVEGRGIGARVVRGLRDRTLRHPDGVPRRQ